MPWFSEIEAESRIVPRKRQVRRQTAQIGEPEASHGRKVRLSVPTRVREPVGSADYLLGVAKGHKRFQCCPQTFLLSPDHYPIFPCPFRLVEGFVGPAE
jgi:hypothetical protein